jgi:hypothetical protein
VDDLDDDDGGVQLGQPLGAQVARRGVARRAAVDVHDEAVAPLGGALDEERVTEVRRVEAPDDEAAGRRR